MVQARPYEDLSIGDMADRARDGWVWVSCPLPCHRMVAVPLSYFVDRYGRQGPAEAIFLGLRCSTCGNHPTTFSLPSYGGTPSDPNQLAPIPWDNVPAPIRAAVGGPPASE